MVITSPNKTENKITWEKEFSLLTNRFILKDLFKVVLIATVIFQILLVLTAFLVDKDVADMIMPLVVDLGIFAGLSLLFLFSMLILGNRYHAEFTVDDKGITYKSGSREKKINRLVLLLLLLLKPRMSGAGFLAVSGESGSFSWKEIYKIISYSKAKVIEVKNSWRTVVRLYCTAENFGEVRSLCNQQLEKADAWRVKNPKKASKKKPFYFYILWIFLAVILTLCATAWSYVEYGDSMIQVIIFSGFLTIVSGFAFGKTLSKIVSLLAVPGTLFFSYQLYNLARKTSEDFMGHTKYGYEYDPARFYITLAGVVFLLAMNVYAVIKRNK
ncbi:MAG: hypothetical protein NTW95_00925 [Candidatus Aminicenantes bacterium]|nr:hypothetical protein [Candidatus Aminicenantes bacterium]